MSFESQYSVDRWSQWDIDCPVGEMGTHVDIGPEVGRLGAAVNPLGKGPELRSTEPPDDLCHLPTIALVHFSSPSQCKEHYLQQLTKIAYRHTDTFIIWLFQAFYHSPEKNVMVAGLKMIQNYRNLKYLWNKRVK